MSILPEVNCDKDIDELRKNHSQCTAILELVAQDAGLCPGEVEFFEDGSNLVGAVGDSVIKLFAPFDKSYHETEHAVLSVLDSRLNIPTPKVRAAGSLQNWPYLIMDKMPGKPLSAIWEGLDFESKRELCLEIGQTTSELHSLDPTDLLHLEPKWESFIPAQRQGVIVQQLKSNLASEWVSQLEEYLDSVVFPHGQLALLHTELAREHFFAEQKEGKWKLSGLIDFEPAMIGNPEYEFASIGLFVSRGNSELFQACLQGYGHPKAKPDFSKRILAYTLLHRYSSLAWYLKFMPTKNHQSLNQLSHSWFS